MANAEVVFEKMGVALEATRGTAVTPPTRTLNAAGTLTPRQDVFRPTDRVGTLAGAQRSEIVGRWSEWSIPDTGLDTYQGGLHLLNMLMMPLAANSGSAGIGAKIWTFTRAMTSDNLKTGTFYWGDANAQIYRGTYGVLDSFSVASDASGTDGATMSASGFTQFQTQIAAPTFPAVSLSPLLVSRKMQLWLDTGANPAGTTEITGRVVSADLTVTTGFTRKFVAVGPSGGVTYSMVGRTPQSPTSRVQVDMVDQAQYQLFEDGADVKMRVRLNGPLIESGFYNYFQWEMYGKMDNPDWGELEGSNRTFNFDIVGEQNLAIASDLVIEVQNNKTAL